MEKGSETGNFRVIKHCFTSDPEKTKTKSKARLKLRFHTQSFFINYKHSLTLSFTGRSRSQVVVVVQGQGKLSTLVQVENPLKFSIHQKLPPTDSRSPTNSEGQDSGKRYLFQIVQRDFLSSKTFLYLCRRPLVRLRDFI